jgi:glycosyltransferase involved in cell wall biosynthesis
MGQLLRGGTGRGWTTSTALQTLSYYSFERELWKALGGRIKAKEFDIVHRVTPLSPTTPSPMARHLKRAGVPFVLGPLNGGVPWPSGFNDRRRAEREWLSYIRPAFKLMPGYSSTRDLAAAIIVGSQFTFHDMPKRVRGKCYVIPENGFDPQRFSGSAKAYSGGRPLKAIFVGRLVPYKGADILIEAAQHQIKSRRLTIEIVGDGPQKDELQSQIDHLDVGHGVQLLGNLPQEQVAEHMKAADFFAFPSVREFGGGVIVEAMAMGLPAIIANYGGPSELVDESTGVRVPFSDRVTLVEGFKRSLSQILVTPGALTAMSSAALARAVQSLSWEEKAKKIVAIYRTHSRLRTY